MKVFAVLAWIGAAVSLFIGILFLVGGPLVGSLLPAELAALGGILGAVGIVLGVLFLGFALLYFFVGRGLWKHQNWARILVLVFAYIGVVGGVLGILMAANAPNPTSVLLQNLISLAIAGFEVWLFGFEPTVKALFAPAPAPASRTRAAVKRRR